MKNILPNSIKTSKKLSKLKTIYLIVCWARWGVLPLKFVKYDKNDIPLVYNYEDHNGTADQYELMSIYHTTTGRIHSWTFDDIEANQIAKELNKRGDAWSYYEDASITQ